MPKILRYTALAAAIAIAGPALAQLPAPAAVVPQAAPPASTAPATPMPSVTTPSVTTPSVTAPPTGATAPTTVNPSPTAPSATARTGAGVDTAANAGASTTLMSGMSVKDSTGALIGEVKSVKGGVATIQMGADTFTVDSAKLGVSNGAANINASQSELKAMLPKKK